MTATVTLTNEINYVAGALDIFVFTLTGSAVYDLSSYRPKGFKPIGLVADFSAATNVDATNWILCDVTNETVSVYTTTSVESAAFSLTATMIATRVGGNA